MLKGGIFDDKPIDALHENKDEAERAGLVNPPPVSVYTHAASVPHALRAPAPAGRWKRVSVNIIF